MEHYENLEIIVDQSNAHKYYPSYTIPESLCHFIKNSANDVKIFVPKIVDAVIAEKEKKLLESH
jgi:hypothetical protein